MPMCIGICCICRKANFTIALTHNEPNSVTILSKLQCIVPEHQWNADEKICLECLEQVNNFAIFKKLCLARHLREHSPQFTLTNESEQVKNEQKLPEEHTLPNLSFDVKNEENDCSNNKWDNDPESTSEDSNNGISDPQSDKEPQKACPNVPSPLQVQTNPTKLDQSSHACDRCARCFTSKQVLNAHATTTCCGVTSESEVKSKCPLCFRVFGNKNALKVHAKTIHNMNLDDVNRCQVCFAQFSNALDLSAHVHTPEEVAEATLHMLRCTECEETFTSTDDLSQHIYTQHDLIWEGEASCEVCHEVFTSGKDATSHYACAHGIKETALVRPYLCAYCPGRYAISDIKNHIRSHFIVDKSYKEVCKYRCHVCGEGFAHARSFEQHFTSEHANGKKNPHPYSCEHCPDKFQSRLGLFKHVRSHLASGNITTLNVDKPRLSCEVCNATFTNVQDVTQHCKSLHNLKDSSMYACLHCPRRFCDPDACAEHISKYFQIEELQECICVTCGASFTNIWNLKVHVKSQHLNVNENECICDRCGKKLRKNTLKTHNMIFHPDLIPPDKLIKCGHCDKSFGSNTDLKLHLKFVNGIKEHQCETCGKKFSLLGNLKKHSVIHTTDPSEKFECPACHKLFNFKQDLGHHMKKEHNLGNSKLKITKPRSERKRNYLCNLCPMTYIDKRELEDHMNAHAGIKPHLCEICNKNFSRKREFQNHMLKQHNTKL